MPANQSHKNRLQAKKDKAAYMQTPEASEMRVRQMTRSAGKAPIKISPTNAGFHHFAIGEDPAHAARKRGAAARKTVTTPAYKPGK